MDGRTTLGTARGRPGETGDTGEGDGDQAPATTPQCEPSQSQSRPRSRGDAQPSQPSLPSRTSWGPGTTPRTRARAAARPKVLRTAPTTSKPQREPADGSRARSRARSRVTRVRSRKPGERQTRCREIDDAPSRPARPPPASQGGSRRRGNLRAIGRRWPVFSLPFADFFGRDPRGRALHSEDRQ